MDWRAASERIRATIRDSNAAGAELLLTDLELASTMLDHAHISGEPGAVGRSRDNAERACETVAGLLRQLTLEDELRLRIERRLEHLKRRLSNEGSF